MTTQLESAAITGTASDTGATRAFLTPFASQPLEVRHRAVSLDEPRELLLVEEATATGRERERGRKAEPHCLIEGERIVRAVRAPRDRDRGGGRDADDRC